MKKEREEEDVEDEEEEGGGSSIATVYNFPGEPGYQNLILQVEKKKHNKPIFFKLFVIPYKYMDLINTKKSSFSCQNFENRAILFFCLLYQVRSKLVQSAISK